MLTGPAVPPAACDRSPTASGPWGPPGWHVLETAVRAWRGDARRTLLPACLLWAGCAEPALGPDGGRVERGRVTTRWYAAQAAAFVNARPAVADGVVYFGLADGGVVARDAAGGAERWRATAVPGERITGANMVAGGGVVVAPGVTQVVALDAATGRERWRFAPPADPTQGSTPAPGLVTASRLALDGGQVFVPAYGASVSALDAATGTVRWVWQARATAADTAPGAYGGRFRSGASGVRVDADVVYGTVWHARDARGLTCEVWLVALDRATGRELWRATEPSQASGICIEGAPAVAAGRVVATHRGGATFAVDQANGTVVWRWAAPARYSTLSEPALADAGGADPVVYVDGGDESAYALGVRDGSVRGRVAAGLGATTDLAVTVRRVYHVSNGLLQVFDRASGSVVAALRTREEGGVFGGVTVLGGRVYLAGFDAAWVVDEP